MSIKAMKQALEALEFYYDLHEEDADSKVIATLRAAIEQAQEPVAWVGPSWLHPETRTWESQSFAAKPIDGWTPLYTAPQPAQKPLKLREIEKCIHDANNDPIVACRNVEAAHGIKEQEP